MKTQAPRATPKSRLLVPALAVLAAFVATPTASAEPLPPLIQLGPAAVANGAITITGQVGGAPPANATLTVNGIPVGIAGSGTFQAVVNLNGASAIVITVATP